MTEPAPLDATFFAFKKRDRHFVLTGATAAYLALSLVLAGAYVAAVWPSLASGVQWYIDTLRSVAGGNKPAPPPVEALLSLAPWALVFWLLSIVLFAAYEAACLRWLVRGERAGVLGLSLGADTWRVFATYWVWIGLLIVFCTAVAGFYLLLRLLGGLHQSLGLPAMLMGALAPLGFLFGLVFVATRLARRRRLRSRGGGFRWPEPGARRAVGFGSYWAHSSFYSRVISLSAQCCKRWFAFR